MNVTLNSSFYEIISLLTKITKQKQCHHFHEFNMYVLMMYNVKGTAIKIDRITTKCRLGHKDVY